MEKLYNFSYYTMNVVLLSVFITYYTDKCRPQLLLSCQCKLIKTDNQQGLQDYTKMLVGNACRLSVVCQYLSSPIICAVFQICIAYCIVQQLMNNHQLYIKDTNRFYQKLETVGNGLTLVQLSLSLILKRDLTPKLEFLKLREQYSGLIYGELDPRFLNHQIIKRAVKAI